MITFVKTEVPDRSEIYNVKVDDTIVGFLKYTNRNTWLGHLDAKYSLLDFEECEGVDRAKIEDWLKLRINEYVHIKCT